MTDAMVIVAASDKVVVESFDAPDGFLFQRITFPKGFQLIACDPESKQHLVDGTHICEDNTDYEILQTDELVGHELTGQLFQYILEGDVECIRLPSKALNHGQIKYHAYAGHHTERNGVNRQLWGGMMQYTAMEDSAHICVTMPDEYECHVQDNEEGEGHLFPLEEGKWLRVVV